MTRAAPVPQCEPVAFQWRDLKCAATFANEPWSYVDYAEGLLIKAHPDKYEVRPLYATPPSRLDAESAEPEEILALVDRIVAGEEGFDDRTEIIKHLRHLAALVSPPSEAGREAIIKQCAQIARDYFEKFDDATKGMLRANNKAVGADIAKEILALSRPDQGTVAVSSANRGGEA